MSEFIEVARLADIPVGKLHAITVANTDLLLRDCRGVSAPIYQSAC